MTLLPQGMPSTMQYALRIGSKEVRLTSRCWHDQGIGSCGSGELMPGCVVRAPPNGKRWSLCRWQYVVMMVRRQRYEESNAASLPYDSPVCSLRHVIIVDNAMAKRDKPDCLLSVHWERPTPTTFGHGKSRRISYHLCCCSYSRFSRTQSYKNMKVQGRTTPRYQDVRTA